MSPAAATAEWPPTGPLVAGREDLWARFALVGGPAAGEAPERRVIRRAPTFLRVVVESTGAIDVLDLPDDEPNDEEAVAVYELILLYHARGKTRRDSGWRADYRHRPDVDGERLRDRDAWTAWCREEHRRRGGFAK